MPYVTTRLTAQGAVIPLLVGVSVPRQEVLTRNNFRVPDRVKVVAQIDSGSEHSAVSGTVFPRLDITPHNRWRVSVPSMESEPASFDIFSVSLGLVGRDGDNLELLLPMVEVMSCSFALEEEIQAFIGRDVLKHCLFIYDGQGDTASLAF